MAWPPSTGATGCTSGPAPGTTALCAAILARFPLLASWGIFNCRRVVGGQTWSLHAEGRAVDIACSAQLHPELGDELLALLRDHATVLQVQRVIWNRTTHSAAYPAGHPYSGGSPHTDHLHIEQTWAGARSLTYAAAAGALSVRSSDEVMIMDFLVQFDNALWIVASDLSSRTQIAGPTDRTNLVATHQYREVVLSAAQMGNVPEVGRPG